MIRYVSDAVVDLLGIIKLEPTSRDPVIEGLMTNGTIGRGVTTIAISMSFEAIEPDRPF